MAQKGPAVHPAQLSLFDAPPPRAAEAAPTPAPPAPRAEPQHTGPNPFHHPQAAREIVLQGHTVAYAWRRARRRSIGFTVGVDGLSVSAPRWVGIGDVERALHDKAGWILRKLAEQDERSRRMQSARIEWRDGAGVPFLGETVIVVIDPRVTGAILQEALGTLPAVPRLTLHVGLPHDAAAEQIRDAVQSWLQRQALRIFEERCAMFAERLGVRVTRISLSAAQTRWGSASVDGSIRLHWRLVHFRMPTIDYVITHELAHLREMNHSAAFWDVVRSVLPDYERSRKSLREEILPTF
jgi:predicted metal-dependent hydrolase